MSPVDQFHMQYYSAHSTLFPVQLNKPGSAGGVKDQSPVKRDKMKGKDKKKLKPIVAETDTIIVKQSKH